MADIPLFKVFLPPREVLMPRLEQVLYSGQISEGAQVVEFENRFSDKFALRAPASGTLSFNSGTAALHAALVLAGVGPGDEVVSTPMTAEPTNMAILHAGAKIVWADVDPHNGNMDAQSLRSVMTPRTKAVMAVHYGGIPVDIDALRNVAQEYGVPLIEDAAHALGASYAWRPIGVHSEFVMFSLQAIKHMTTVDGGMLVCNAAPDIDALLAQGRKFRWFGIDRAAPRTEVDVTTIGYKYHMNNVTAAIGLVQLDSIDVVLEAHRQNGRWLDEALKGIPGLRLCSWSDKAEPSYWFYTVLAERRDELMRHLTAKSIGNSMAHKRNDWHSVFGESRCDLPGVDAFYGSMLHIPCGWWVGAEERERIVDALRQGW